MSPRQRRGRKRSRLANGRYGDNSIEEMTRQTLDVLDEKTEVKRSLLARSKNRGVFA